MNPQARFPYILRVASIFIVVVLMVVTLYYLKVVLVPLLFSIIFAVMLFPFFPQAGKMGSREGPRCFYNRFYYNSLIRVSGVFDIYTAEHFFWPDASTFRKAE